MHRAAPTYLNGLLRAFAMLVLTAVASASPAVAKQARAPVEIPVVLQLIGTSGEMASLAHLVSRPLVRDFAGGDPVVSPLETGFQLDFTPTLLAGGRIGVTLDLSIAWLAGPIHTRRIPTPAGMRKVQEAELATYEVSASFEAADGETRALDSVPDGPPILATLRIVAPSEGSPSMVLLEVRVPHGGHEVELENLQLLKTPRVVGVPARRNSLRHLTRRTFVGGVASGEAVTTQLESGIELEATTDVAGAKLGLDLGVRCRTFDERVPVFPVPTPNGIQKVELPILRTLDVATSANVASGQTVVLAGVRAAGTEALIFATPRRFESDGLENVLVEARVVVAAGEPKEPKNEPVVSQSLKEFELTGWLGREMSLSQVQQRDFVTGHQDGEPVSSPLETEARLRFMPTLLGADDADLEIAIDYGQLDPDVGRKRVKTSARRAAVDLPVVHLLQLDTGVAVASGQTLVVGGLLREEARDRQRTSNELLIFVTPRVGASDDPDAVALSARVVHASEGDGPARSSIERLESGPVELP